jgi:hypothetical protein
MHYVKFVAVVSILILVGILSHICNTYLGVLGSLGHMTSFRTLIEDFKYTAKYKQNLKGT